MIWLLLDWLSEASNWTGTNGILARLAEHLAITGGVVLAGAALALPVGALIGHSGRGGGAVAAIAGAVRALPTLGLLTIFGLWFGIGLGAPMLALLVLAVPPLLAGAYSGIDSADRTTVDAARAIGLTEWQILRDVELPAAAGILMGSLRSAILQVVATATLAAYTADAGLGRFIFAGMKTRDYGEMLGGALLVVLLALALDALLALATRAVLRRAAPQDRAGTPAGRRTAGAGLGAPAGHGSKAGKDIS